MKRILKDKCYDYKLSPNVNKKIKKNWNKEHKKATNKKQKKLKYTAYQEQAGVIITRWAKKILETREINYKKNLARRRRKIASQSKHKHKSKDKKNQNDAQKAMDAKDVAYINAESRKNQRQQMYQEQADIIYSIIT